ncbi:hypothetical protein ACTFIW_012301 [Dictyostelium discoideum]
MGKLNRLYERIFNSPRNFDSISLQKTKHLLFQFCVLGAIGWIIFFVVLIYDVLNQQVFVNNEIRDIVQVPSFTVFLRFTNMDYFSLNNLTMETDYNELDYGKVESCYYSQSEDQYLCENFKNEENKNLNSSIYYHKKIDVEPFNITFQQTYINLNIQSILDNSTQGLGFVFRFGDYAYSLVGPMKAELLFKTEMIIDQGVETLRYIPNLVTSLLDDKVCQKYSNTLELRNNCSSISLSIIYQSNIVPRYSLETGPQLLIRILINTFSIGKLTLVLLSLVFSFYSKKFLFKKRTSWFENSVRDAVLYHFNFYVLENDKPCLKKEKLTKLEKSIVDQGDLDRLLNKNEKIIKNEQETMGSESKYKRLLEGIPPQDKYSISLSRFSLFQIIVSALILILIGIFIATKDLKNRLATTSYNDIDYLELPSFNFTIESVRNSTDTYLLKWEETLPNEDFLECTSFLNGSYVDFKKPTCDKTLDYPSNTTSIEGFPTISYNSEGGSILVGKNQNYSLVLYTFSVYNTQYQSPDLTYATLYINDIVYYVRPYSNISIELTKSVFHQVDGTNITSYEPSVTSVPLTTISVPNAFTGTSYIYIWYSSNVVSDIYLETNYQLIKRTFTDISSFISPITTIVGLFFTKILIKIYFKYSTAHVDFKVREAIIYHLRYYENYKSIYRTNNRKSQKLNINNNNNNNNYQLK